MKYSVPSRKFISVVGLIALLTLSNLSFAKAWFGAGKTPGIPPVTTGLSGEIALPIYKFAPDFYLIGDTVTLNVTGFNPANSDVTSHYYLVINEVTQSPIGSDITDGTPSTPGINENDLNTNHLGGNDVQTQVTTMDLGNVVFPANGQTTFGGSYTTTKTGYYHFQFSDVTPVAADHVLAYGYFRVQAPAGGPQVTPTPTPGANSTPTPTPNPTGGKQSAAGINPGSVCSGTNFDAYLYLKQDGNPVAGVNVKFVYHNEAKFAKTQNDGRVGVAYGYVDESDVQFIPEDGFPSQSQKVVHSTSTQCPPQNQGSTPSKGQVLGATTGMAETGSVEDMLVNASGLLGAGLSAIGMFLYGKKK